MTWAFVGLGGEDCGGARGLLLPGSSFNHDASTSHGKTQDACEQWDVDGEQWARR